MPKYGTTRVVYFIGKYAIKIPVIKPWRHFLRGLLANISEAQFSSVEDFTGLCPVIFSLPGGFLNVMRKAEPLPRETFEVESFYDEYLSSNNLPKGGMVEDKLDSFGILDGSVVAVDYG